VGWWFIRVRNSEPVRKYCHDISEIGEKIFRTLQGLSLTIKDYEFARCAGPPVYLEWPEPPKLVRCHRKGVTQNATVHKDGTVFILGYVPYKNQEVAEDFGWIFMEDDDEG